MTSYFASNLSPFAVAIIALAMVLVVAVMDYFLGPEIGMFVFYLPPIFWATWRLGFLAGAAVSFFAVAAWLYSEFLSREFALHPGVVSWNGGIRLVLFLGVAFLVARLRQLTRNLAGQVASKTLSLESEVEQRRKAEDVLGQQSDLLNLAYNAILVRDMDNRITFWNRGAKEMYGWDEEEALGRFSHELLRSQSAVPPERIQHELLQAGRWAGEMIHQTRSGGKVVVASRWALQKDARGSPKAILEINNDITKSKEYEEKLQKINQELERRVQDRTAQLDERVKEVELLNRGMVNLLEDLESARVLAEESAVELKKSNKKLDELNKELETFSYTVSHDLRAPLRAIAGFSEALRESCGGRLEEDEQEYIRRIGRATERMGALIEGILKLSRVSRSKLQRQPIDLSARAEELVQDLSVSDSSRKVEFVIQPNVSAQGDPALMEVVLENLLGNAWKFTTDKEAARIEFGLRNGENGDVFFVRDNGVGFSAEQADQLFKPFQRLHSGEKFKGSGIGLATVQRIIERHGGRVWAEGAAGEGATFYFTLGKLKG